MRRRITGIVIRARKVTNPPPASNEESYSVLNRIIRQTRRNGCGLGSLTIYAEARRQAAHKQKRQFS